MFAKTLSCAVIGLNVEEVEVEIDISPGLGNTIIVGLPDTAIQEAKERIKAAIKNSGFHFPTTRLTINLAPADLKKEGPAYDLAMAVGILAASGQLFLNPKDSLFIGELALDGKLRHTQGILPRAIFAKEKRFKRIYIPEVNAQEANLVKDLEIIPVKTLPQLASHLSGKERINSIKGKGITQTNDEAAAEIDMAFIKGQEHIKRALEIAAAGAHNVLMTGPPGAGKTLLARAMPSILPSITSKEALEVTKIYSIAGKLPKNQPLITKRPFRSPHHSSSQVALVGGGQFPHPGEITLAHRGVLFLDELPEFPKHVLEALRGPLEDGVVTISRAQMTLTFPASFTLIASQNPCPCGYLNDPEKECRCTPSQISRYKKKISGPLLDRIDMHIEVPRVKFDKLTSEKVAESSKTIRSRVQKAHDIQLKRFKEENLASNAEMKPQHIKKFCQIDKKTLDLLRTAVNHLRLSARAYHKVLKIGRTIADLAGEEKIQTSHIAEALQYRPKEE